MVNSSYEPIELGEHSDVSKGVHLKIEEMVPRVDSMVNNTAYSRESHGGQTSAVTNDLEAGEERGEYEAVVMLQSNSSYNYVTPMPLPNPSRED